MNFWIIPDTNNIRTPLSILREQAGALTEATKGALKGEVLTAAQDGGGLVLALGIVVPALNNYRYKVLTYYQPITLYPGDLFWEATHFSIQNEEDLIQALKTILSAKETQNVIKSLLAQANEVTP